MYLDLYMHCIVLSVIVFRMIVALNETETETDFFLLVWGNFCGRVCFDLPVERISFVCNG